jgi:hypothetical protein
MMAHLALRDFSASRRRVRKLKLHEKVMCWRCCVQGGRGYRISDGSAPERAEGRARRIKRVQARSLEAVPFGFARGLDE